MRTTYIRAFVLTIAMLGVFLQPTAASADTVSATQMQAMQNQLRYAVGAPTIPADARLVTAAQNHATYSALNGSSGHYETAGLPGYTGYAPRDRVVAAGWTTPFVSEVATGGSSALSAVQVL